MSNNNQIKFPYPKGSEWRKWDLQVHSPGTKLADGYGNSRRVWREFLKILHESDVKVFAITDYFLLDGYLSFLKSAKELRPQLLKDKVFFPNIEFRLDISTNIENEEVHLHLIFNNEEKIVKRIPAFLQALELETSRDQSSKLKCVDGDLQKIGYDAASVSLKSLKDTLKKEFGDERVYLKIAAVAGAGSNRADSESPRKLNLHDEIDKFSDAFFGSSGNTDWYLKQKRLEDKDIKIRPKPVFSTSDSHSIEDCKNFIGKEYVRDGILEKEVTWVKANPTFEGLRQTLFEPKARVKIQTGKPEEKKPYLVIDKVRFSDNSGKNIFQSEAIELNQNLNVIIGGRSMGKSLLLYFLAKTIDCEEVSKRFEDVPPPPNYEKNMNMDDFDFEVVWKDKNLDKLSRPSEEIRKILYIPQNYLSSLSDLSDIDKKKALNEFIFEVIKQDEEVNTEYENNINLIRSKKDTTTQYVSDYFSLKATVNDKKNKVEKIGNAKGISEFIKRLKSDIGNLKKEAGLSMAQVGKIKKLVTQRDDLRKNLANLQKDKENIDFVFQELKDYTSNIQEVIAERLDYIIDSDVKSLVEKRTDWTDRLNNHLEKSYREIDDKLASKRNRYKKTLGQTEAELKPLLGKIKKQKEVKKLIETLKTEEEKLNRIETLKKSIDFDLKKLGKLSQKIFSLYKDIFEIYKSNQSLFKKGQSQLENVILTIKIQFRDKEFDDDYIQNYINRHDVKRVLGETTEEYHYKYDASTHFEKIEKLLYGLLYGEIKPKVSRQGEEAVRGLLEDYWALDFSVTYEDDTLETMSPGKLALTLLKLLILLRKDAYPILIDQPEADLDNRSVYQELVKYVKRKKTERQIILVTHNPNLVVGADAEEVIVANQSRDSEKKFYQFEYISSALENTKTTDKRIKAVLFRQGIREHVCEILEGGEEAFKKREEKYCFPEDWEIV
jgi:hypothetical protein